MRKLTQQEAKELIRQAWLDVEKYGYGSYRFGQSVHNLIPTEISKQYEIWIDSPTGRKIFNGYVKDVDFYYEQNCDIVLEKFFKFFVEE